MTQEDKELLLEDLCARMPYGVKVWYKYETWHCRMFATSIRLADGKIALSSKFNKEGDWYPIEEAEEILIKPYLCSMSSMTDEEVKEFYEVEDMDHPVGYIKPQLNWHFTIKGIDWLNVHHFDYRGLIERGLALEAPKGMYNINEK